MKRKKTKDEEDESVCVFLCNLFLGDDTKRVCATRSCVFQLSQILGAAD